VLLDLLVERVLSEVAVQDRDPINRQSVPMRRPRKVVV
jgi:hypothetical protein